MDDDEFDALLARSSAGVAAAEARRRGDPPMPARLRARLHWQISRRFQEEMRHRAAARVVDPDMTAPIADTSLQPEPDVGAYAVDVEGLAWLRHRDTGWTEYRSTPTGWEPTGQVLTWDQLHPSLTTWTLGNQR